LEELLNSSIQEENQKEGLAQDDQDETECNPSTIEEISKVVKTIKNNKASGKDNISNFTSMERKSY
jgi:hypothetical protein